MRSKELLLHAACPVRNEQFRKRSRFWIELSSVTCLTYEGLVVTEGVNQLNDYTPAFNDYSSRQYLLVWPESATDLDDRLRQI